jgi:hypothetical protein
LRCDAKVAAAGQAARNLVIEGSVQHAVCGRCREQAAAPDRLAHRSDHLGDENRLELARDHQWRFAAEPALLVDPARCRRQR